MSGGDICYMEAVDPDVIRMRVENVKDLTEVGVKSEVKRINGFPWQLHIFRGEHSSICAIIECKKNEESEVWDCEVEWEMSLVKQTNNSRIVCEENTDEVIPFHTWSPIYDLECMILTQDQLEDKCIVVNGSIVVESKIVVREGNEERFRKRRPQIDFFSPSNLSDVIISIKGKNLHVSKQILANVSSYFEALFFGDFKESQKKEITLGEVDFEDFATMLNVVYDTGAIDDDDLESLLIMADRFNIPKIMMAVEERLSMIYCCRIPLHLKLLLSDRYNLYALQELCLSWASSRCHREIVAKSESYNQFSNELKNKLMELEKDEGPMRLRPKKKSVNGLIQMRVENVKDLTKEGVISEVQMINGFPFQLRVCRKEYIPDNLVVRIESNMSLECEQWMIPKVVGKVKLINHIDDANSISKIGTVLKPYGEIWNEDAFSHELKELTTINGLTIDGNLDIEVMINVTGQNGDRFRKNPRTDFYSPSRFSDVIFIVEGKKMYASKQILAHASSHFEKFFYGEFKDSNNHAEIVVNDISSEEFMVILEMIYDARRQCTDGNVEFLLKMAKKYEITGFLDRAEKWLLRGYDVENQTRSAMDTRYPLHTRLPMHMRLRLADQFKLEVLKDHIIKDIEVFDEVEELNNSDSYKYYSREIVDNLMKKMITCCKNLKDDWGSDEDMSD